MRQSNVRIGLNLNPQEIAPERNRKDLLNAENFNLSPLKNSQTRLNENSNGLSFRDNALRGQSVVNKIRDTMQKLKLVKVIKSEAQRLSPEKKQQVMVQIENAEETLKEAMQETGNLAEAKKIFAQKEIEEAAAIVQEQLRGKTSDEFSKINYNLRNAKKIEEKPETPTEAAKSTSTALPKQKKKGWKIAKSIGKGAALATVFGAGLANFLAEQKKGKREKEALEEQNRILQDYEAKLKEQFPDTEEGKNQKSQAEKNRDLALKKKEDLIREIFLDKIKDNIKKKEEEEKRKTNDIGLDVIGVNNLLNFDRVPVAAARRNMPQYAGFNPLSDTRKRVNDLLIKLG